MGDPLLKAHLDKLVGVHPALQDAVRRIVIAMDALGFQMIVTDGVRTAAQQQALYAEGRNGSPVPIVTNADGIIKRSNHQVHADGLGHAVDMTFLDKSGAASWNGALFPFALYGAMAHALGLVWGGSWGSIHDAPHVELPDGVPQTGASHA